MFQSSFLNQYLIIDQISKFSHLDILLIQLNLKTNNSLLLYNAFVNDIMLNLNVYYTPLSTLFQSEYQEIFSTLLLIAPELSIAFVEYFNSFIFSNILNSVPSPVFDIYMNNLNFYFSEGIIHFFLFFFYIFFIVYIFSSLISLK